MKRRILIALALCGLGIGVAMLAPETVAASPKTEICEGVGAVSSGGCSGGTNALDGIVKVVVQLFAAIIGLAAVIMMMIAGFKYTTAGGDSGKVGEAKKTIIYALIGIVVAASAQSIVWFVLNKASDANTPKDNQNKTTLVPASEYYSIEINNKNVV